MTYHSFFRIDVEFGRTFALARRRRGREDDVQERLSKVLFYLRGRSKVVASPSPTARRAGVTAHFVAKLAKVLRQRRGVTAACP